MRDGEFTGARRMKGVTLRWIVEAMIGGETKDFSTSLTYTVGAEVFRAGDVALPKTGGGNNVDHVSLSVIAGEILGIFGLMGRGARRFWNASLAGIPMRPGRSFSTVSNCAARALPIALCGARRWYPKIAGKTG